MKDESTSYSCAICSKIIKQGEFSTIRTRWLTNGGFGVTPPEAIVHAKCNKKEQERINNSKNFSILSEVEEKDLRQ